MRDVSAKMQEKLTQVRERLAAVKAAGDKGFTPELAHQSIEITIDIAETAVRYAATLEAELNELDRMVEEVMDEVLEDKDAIH